jgi:GT2 family glycosyltransferase
MIRIAVAYATLGRPELIARSIDHLQRQTRRPDVVIVSAAQASDIAGLDRRPEIILGDKGLCKQRNRALAAVAGRADVILFFDDDFVPREDYVEQTVALFAARPTLAGATGHVIADGIKTPGIDFDEAIALIRQEPPRAAPAIIPRDSLYGCNMAIRMRAAAGLEFDERLPLYGWLEDADYTYRLGRRGPLVLSQALVGVHLGTKGGRTSERRLGYSQIANPIYMLRKRSIPRKMAAQKIIRNIAANLLGCILPESYINRPSRLAGNMIAIRDFALNRMSPDKILEIDT